MARIMIFGGTTEGREEATRLFEAGNDVLVCVTSSYAKELLLEKIPCHVGAMDVQMMRTCMADFEADEVVDATHPFAVQVTKNIVACCKTMNLPYRRILREKTEEDWVEAVQWVQNSHEAAKAGAGETGNVLLTTGSHTLKDYAACIPAHRLYVRVLPTAEALSLCEEAGIEKSHILAAQGPFSQALNEALLDMWHIGVMITKDSGKKGGVAEKVLPALAKNIRVIVIRRPEEERHAW